MNEIINKITDEIKEYEKQDPMTSETLARIEELHWVLHMLDKIKM